MESMTLTREVAGAPSIQPLRPFLKWAGGKSRLLSEIKAAAPERFNRYFEPFLGGAAVYLALRPEKALLSDSNSELIRCYQAVRDTPHAVIKRVASLHISEADFYSIRALDPTTLDPVNAAARVIYLNKTCYNGLYRVNRQGHFNTPYGKRADVTLLDPDHIIAISKQLQGAQLECASFSEAYASGHKRGDFIYLDPPYVPTGPFADFKRYTKEQFGADDQEQLASWFTRLHKRGVHVLLSNSDHPVVVSLYRGFFAKRVLAPRAISCKGTGRAKTSELLIASYPFSGAARL